MASFDPDKYFETTTNSGDWRTAIDLTSYNHYERLGFQFGDRLSNEEIKDAFQKRYNWWTEKDKIAKSGKAHPVVKVVGPFTQDAIKNLQDAKDILLNSALKYDYDTKLRNELNRKVEEEFLKFVRFALKDKTLSHEEKSNLLHEADTLGIAKDRAEEIIRSEMIKTGATEKANEKSVSTTPESFPNYYDLLEISLSANNSEIEEAYKKQFSIWNSRAANPKFRDEVPRKKKLLQDARDTLTDLNRRKEYDRQLKEALETPISATGSGIPKLEINKTSFDYDNLRKDASVSGSFTINNGGGGILNGPIKTNKKWLKVTQTSIDTARHKQDISFYINTSSLVFGLKDNGTIEIQSNGGTERINVNISIEEDKEAISRFRTGLTIGGNILGALFGYFIYNLNFVEGMNENVVVIAGMIALICAVIFGAKLGYKNGGVGTAFGWGFGTFIAGLIILAILNDYFPPVFSTIAWALIYAAIAGISARSIWRGRQRGNKIIPIAVGVGTVMLSAVIVFIGSEAAKQIAADKKSKADRTAAESKAQAEILRQTISKLSGEWEGKVDNKDAKLFITRNGDKLSGTMVYDGFEEKLAISVNFEKNKGLVVVLKGTDYKRLSGRGNLSLDTFYISSISSTKLEGNYVDKRRHKGRWFASRVSAPVSYNASGQPEPVQTESGQRNPEPTKGRLISQETIDRIANSAPRHAETAKVTVAINTSPSGAKVFIDNKDQPAGTTPLKISLDKGPHGIHIKKDGYKDVWGMIRDSQQAFDITLSAE